MKKKIEFIKIKKKGYKNTKKNKNIKYRENHRK